MSTTTNEGGNSSLRQRAELQAKAADGLLETLSLADAQKLLHELQTHKAELEMQNEELRRVQAELETEKERYFHFFELAPAAFLSITEKGLILEANLTATSLLGVVREALVGQPITAFIFPADQDKLYQHRQRLFKTRSPQACDLRMVKKDGTIFWVHLSSNAVQNADGVIVCRAVVTDITERKRAEDALRESEAKLRAVTENVQLGIVVHAPDTSLLLSNPMATQILGLTPEQLRGKTAIDPAWCFIREDGTTMPLAEYPVNRALAEATPIHGLVLGIIRPDRPAPTWVDCDARKIWGPTGELEQVIVAFSDITKQKRAEEQLCELNGRLLLATASAQAGVWDWNLQTGEMIWDDRMFELYGLRRESFPGGVEAWEQGLHPDDASRAKEECQAALRGERGLDTEFRVRRPDGTVVHIKANGLVLRDKQGKLHHMIGLNTDITQRKSLEEQLRQSQKLDSIGQLAGGIAHDYNNLLASTMMNLGMLQGNPNLDAEAQETLRELTEEAQRAANLTRQLLLFSRRSIMEVKVLDLNDLMGNLLKMLGRLLGEHITIQFDRTGNLPPVEADPGMLEQVIMNLAVNARDAMPKGGRLTFSLKPIQVDAERIKGNIEVQPGLFVCLSVTDTGCGMDAATLKRIFEPFFTTKEVGKGTGLGLATAYGIVAQHKGWVEVESELGKGSTFKVFLPTTKKSTAAAVPSGKPVVQQGQETILVVEDDVVLRGVATRVFLRLGYRVLEAENGQMAMKLWQERAGQIDLLFSDMVMPEGMTGLDLAEKLRAQKPGLKVIITSGYNAEMVAEGRPTADGIRYLQKPYQIEVLSKVVRECLEGEGATTT